MTISTTILQAYDVCKKIKDTNTCRQEAINNTPQAVDLFLKSYDSCLLVSDADTCRKIFAYDIPTPPVIPFLLGLGLGMIIFGSSKKSLNP